MSLLLEECLTAYVKTVAPLTALIGAAPAPTRFYPNRAPDAAKTPYAVYTQAGLSPVSTHDPETSSSADACRVRFQISCWSPDLKEAKTLAKAFKTALHKYYGQMGDRARIAAFVDNTLVLWDLESREHHVVVDVFLWDTGDN